jgi:hypothetical protein
MANRYVWSGAGGAGTGADWANAHLTMTAAITASAAGDTFYVAHDHNEVTAGALTLTWKGTFASPDKVLCVDRAGSVPPVAADLRTTAIVSTSGNSAMTLVTVNSGAVYIEGIIFRTAASGGSAVTTASITQNSGTTALMVFRNCLFDVSGNSHASTRVLVANAGNIKTVWDECQCKFGSASHAISCSSFAGEFRWFSRSALAAIAAGGTTPSNLLVSGASHFTFRLDGLDLSSIVNLTASNAGNIVARNCKLHASVAFAAYVSPVPFTEIINCNSGGTVQRNERYTGVGTLTTETTIVRTGGADDGPTAFSWKIVPDADNERTNPFETFEGALWNDDTGSAKTLTVHTVTDNVTLTDAEIWLEVDYLGDSGAPVTTRVSDEAATILTTPANQAASTETWTTTGLATPVKQKLEVTFTPQLAGPIRWRVKYAKASTTVYVCPKAELS